jgi:hypothetical protein
MNNLTSNTTNQLSVLEAANISGKSIHTIKKLIAQKKIKTTKISGKFGHESRIELNDIMAYYGPNNINLSIRGIKEKVNISNDITPKKTLNIIKNNDLLNQFIIDQNDFLKKEIESLKNDKLKLYEEIESKRKEVEKVHTLLENQQTLSLGLQQQIKSLTDNSSQNIPENSKPQHTTVEAKVSNPPKASKNTQNFDLFDESNQTPVEEINAPQKRRKWWFF